MWRYLEIGYLIVTHKQNTLGLADEAADAIDEFKKNQEQGA